MCLLIFQQVRATCRVVECQAIVWKEIISESCCDQIPFLIPIRVINLQTTFGICHLVCMISVAYTSLYACCPIITFILSYFVPLPIRKDAFINPTNMNSIAKDVSDTFVGLELDALPPDLSRKKGTVILNFSLRMASKWKQL